MTVKRGFHKSGSRTIQSMEKSWWEPGSYRFTRLPNALLENEKYTDLADGAKLLYAILANRLGLSAQNGLRDERGVYVFCTNKEICGSLRWSHQKATAMLRELERVGLIRRVKRGQGRPDRIYVEKPEQPCAISAFQDAEIRHPRVLKISSLECTKSAPIKTEYSKTDSIQTYLSRSGDDPDVIRSEIKDNLSFDLLEQETGDQAAVEEILELMVSVCSGTEPVVRIGRKDLDGRTVRDRLLSLDGEHIRYVLECLAGQKIRNRRAYLLTALYNAPDTMDDYYDRQVVRDMPWLNTS